MSWMLFGCGVPRLWVVPALLVAGLALSVAWKERAATLRGLAMMVRSPFLVAYCVVW
ncbi:hypothetical protein PCI56_18170 [Plesiomonas shigelloides subsp. oncorhynchi]|nr:hypothetical protein [Plesiomonas shigelloides]